LQIQAHRPHPSPPPAGAEPSRVRPLPFGLRYRRIRLRYRSLASVQAPRSLPSSGAALSPRRATHLSFASPKESKPRKGDPQSGSLRFATGTLRCSKQAGSRANSPAAQTSTIPDPLASPLLSPARTGGGRIRIRGALSPLRALNDAMFLIAASAGIYWGISLNPREIARGNSRCINVVAFRTKRQTSPGFAKFLSP
jgi:hypothetical protein